MLVVVEGQDDGGGYVNESGLMRVGGVVVLSGPALRTTLECVVVAIRASKTAGRPHHVYETLACELAAGMSANGQTDVRLPAVCDSVPVEQQPTVPVTEAADRLNISLRQARRLAPQLGGKKIAGSWLVDELALREHIEGRQ